MRSCISIQEAQQTAFNCFSPRIDYFVIQLNPNSWFLVMKLTVVWPIDSWSPLFHEDQNDDNLAISLYARIIPTTPPDKKYIQLKTTFNLLLYRLVRCWKFAQFIFLLYGQIYCSHNLSCTNYTYRVCVCRIYIPSTDLQLSAVICNKETA